MSVLRLTNYVSLLSIAELLSPCRPEDVCDRIVASRFDDGFFLIFLSLSSCNIRTVPMGEVILSLVSSVARTLLIDLSLSFA